MSDTHTLEVQALIKNLKDMRFEKPSIEHTLLQKKLIRQLYTLVGEPNDLDFPNECALTGGGWTKHKGYTNWISVLEEDSMLRANSAPTDWQIKHPSDTKERIVERYIREGWSCTVQAYNVICQKFVKHPHIDNLWVYFYSSRDCNKYEYVIEDK